jgi:hypothetical protein
MQLASYLTMKTQRDTKYTNEPNVNPRIVKFSEENIGLNIHELEIGKYSLHSSKCPSDKRQLDK